MKRRDIDRFAKEAGLTRSDSYGGWLATDDEMAKLISSIINDYAMQADEVREAVRNKKKQETLESMLTFAVNAERERIATALDAEGWMAAASMVRQS